jgi:hypothetical protein
MKSITYALVSNEARRCFARLRLLDLPGIGVYDLHMIRINIFLPERVVAALKALSEKTGLSYAEHIRRAIDAYLKKESK